MFSGIGEKHTTIWNGFELEIVTNNDSITYSFYYPQDPLDWLTQPDSTFLILAQVSRSRPPGVSYLDEISESEKEKYAKIFTESIFEPLTGLLKVQEPYRVNNITDSTTDSQKFVLCKTQLILNCDTLEVIYGDRGRYELSTPPGDH